MRPKHLHGPELKLQESFSQPSIPVERLRILARIIARRLERKRQQLKLSNNIDENKVEHAKYRILREKKEGKR